MVAYVSIYKSRIVQPPMFSRPHINPGGEKAMHPVIVQWLTPLVVAWPPISYLSGYERYDRSHVYDVEFRIRNTLSEFSI